MNRVAVGLVVLLSAAGMAQGAGLAVTAVNLGGVAIRAEIADTPRAREQGLMDRPPLADDQGMLFVFERVEEQCFWMKNTPSALSIAFIDYHGQVLALADMQPESEALHCSGKPAGYALEMRQGWFDDHGVRVGDRLTGGPFALP